MAVLTPEQQTKVAEMRKQRRDEWRKEHGGRHGHRHERDSTDDHHSGMTRDSIPPQ